MIRYDRKINNEINRIVRNYNAKIYRLERKDKYNIYYIPKKITRNDIKEIKKSVSSRADLRNRLKDIELYTKRNAERYTSVNGQSISNYQYNVLKRNRRIALNRLSRQIKYYETTKPTSSGTRESTTFAQAGRQEYLTSIAKRRKIEDMKINDNLDIERFIRFLQVNTKIENYQTWKNNYLKMINDVANSYNIGNSSDIINKLNKLTPRELDKLIQTESTLKQIIYYYKSLADLGVDLAAENLSMDVSSIFNDLNENLDNEIQEIIG